MKSLKPLIGGLIAALILILVGSPASAQDRFKSTTPKIAIVDVQAIMREALSSKSAREQMNAIAKKEQTEFAAEENKLRARDQKLQQQRSILTPEVFAERQRALQSDVGQLQRRSRNLRLTLDQGLSRTMEQIQLVLFDELRKLMAELDLNLIVQRSQIVIAIDDFDLTKTALERLNKRLPLIELTLDKRKNSSKAN